MLRDYTQQLLEDLPIQYQEKHRIEVFQKAMARQLNELYSFFYALHTRRTLSNAEGAQLDGIGDIVMLSRGQALAIAESAEMLTPMDDVMYRMYLAWKIALNTTVCTHSDVYRALKLFWSDTPIYYSEQPEYPAMAIYTIPRPVFDYELPLFRVASRVKAAGVTLTFNFSHQTTPVVDYSGAVEFVLIREHIKEGA